MDYDPHGKHADMRPGFGPPRPDPVRTPEYRLNALERWRRWRGLGDFLVALVLFLLVLGFASLSRADDCVPAVRNLTGYSTETLRGMFCEVYRSVSPREGALSPLPTVDVRYSADGRWRGEAKIGNAAHFGGWVVLSLPYPSMKAHDLYALLEHELMHVYGYRHGSALPERVTAEARHKEMVEDGRLSVLPPRGPEKPYLEANATRIQSYVKTFPGVTEALVEQKGFWGAELFGRVPIGERWAIIGRAYSEGAAGAYSFRDPSTWWRGVGEGALTYKVLSFALDDTPGRYALGLMAGGGASMMLERGRYTEGVPDDKNELEGPPPKFGAGLQLRDTKLRVWVALSAQWDKAVGEGASWCGGCLLAASVHFASVHFPVLGERAGFGVDVTRGDYTKVNLLTKVRLFRWGAK